MWLFFSVILWLNLLIAAFNDKWSDMKEEWQHESAIAMFKAASFSSIVTRIL